MIILKKNQGIKAGIGALIFIGITLQLFSGIVSFKTVIEFTEVYIPFFPIASTLAFFIVLGIEILIRVFGHSCIMKYETNIPNIILGSFAVMFIFLSAFLTTISPGKIVVDNLEYKEFVQEDSTLNVIKTQVQTDNQRLLELSYMAKNRRWKANTPKEESEIRAIQKRLDYNNELISSAMLQKIGDNKNIESWNNTIRKDGEMWHNQFGFFSQIFLVLTVIGVHYLKKELPKEENGNPKETYSEHEGNVKEIERETRGKSVGNGKEIRTKKQVNEISINEGTQRKILELVYQGFSTREIMEKLKIKSPATITKACQSRIMELCKSEELNYNDPKERESALIAHGLSTKPFKELEKFMSQKNGNNYVIHRN